MSKNKKMIRNFILFILLIILTFYFVLRNQNILFFFLRLFCLSFQVFIPPSTWMALRIPRFKTALSCHRLYFMSPLAAADNIL